jgi:DNA replication and repair protein RecF
MKGAVEKIINNENFLEIYKTELKNRRQKDGISNSTTFGINRSDWQVFHISKQINAEYCSAGEQKMLILAVFFSFISHYINSDERNSIILLDDVITHLDTNHRRLLFKYIQEFVITNKKVSVWLSGTDLETFAIMKESAKFYEIQN